MFMSITAMRPTGPQICDVLPVYVTKAEILKRLLELHNPEAAQRTGMVYQIWEDGEITCQKSGDLLWRRNLHMFKPGTAHPELKKFLLENLPVKDRDHAYIWCDCLSNEAEREIWEMIDSWQPDQG